MTPGQLQLFAEPKPNGDNARGALPHGPRGLLKTLVQRGLAEDALEAAAALVLEMDAEAIGRGE
jgi:hypothetical protein